MAKIFKNQPSPSSSSNRRSNFIIILKVLDAATEGRIRTHLAQSARLSYRQLQQYLPTLVKLGLIQNDGNVFKTTAEGKELATKLESIAALLEVKPNAQ